MRGIDIFRLQPHQIKELRNPRTLYLVDFRAISSSISQNSFWVYYYENMVLPVIEKGWAVMNEGALPEYTTAPGVTYITADAPEKTLTPLAYRLSTFKNWDDIDQIWTAIPHPAIDALATEKGKKLNYGFEAYRRNNDKLTQKRCLPPELTPAWKEGVHDAAPGYLLKHRFGCGGLEVWHPDHTHNLDGVSFSNLVQQNPDGWYQEKLITGISCSASLYTEGDDTIIFGWSKLIFPQRAPLSCLGGRLYDPAFLAPNLLSKLKRCITALQEGVLENYQGFWGIDFMIEVSTQEFYFLEANVRLTTLTVPHLILGKLGLAEGIFQEDMTVVKKGGIVLNKDTVTPGYDVLEL